jgi:myosin heavy subunit
MSDIQVNQPNDRVYVRDIQYEWLPGVIEEVNDHKVLVRIELPKEWYNTTITQEQQQQQNTDNNVQNEQEDKHDEKRWIELKDYNNHHLPMQNEIHMKGCCDMTELQHIHEAEILYQLKERHCILEKPYTRVGNILVAINPCRYIPSLYTLSQQQLYFEHIIQSPLSSGTYFNFKMDYVYILFSFLYLTINHSLLFVSYLRKEVEASIEEKKEDVAIIDVTSIESTISANDSLKFEPHIYEVSSMAYRELIHSKTNQTILVSGESGSGKTETIKLVLKHLANFIFPGTSQHQHQQQEATIRTYNDDDLVSHILASSPIFESFGNAKTIRNANSSRFGKVTKLHYSITNDDDHNHACLIGSSFQTYLLESNRVVSHVNGESNYHIFYQMLAAPSAVKNELLGPDWREATSSNFRYLNQCPRSAVDNALDASNWTYTLKALIIFGWDGNALEQLIRGLGIILLIGNIKFQDSNDDNNKLQIVEQADLNILSNALGVPVEEVELALTQRTIQTAQDLLLVPLTVEQANEARDALAKVIYTRIFGTIVRQINFLTSSPSTVSGIQKEIALLDIFGFESFEVNRFDQFCINYANERLHQKYVLDCLNRRSIEYEAEDILLPEWKAIDNTSTIELFDSIPGIIKTLHDQCILPNGNNEVSSFFITCQLGTSFFEVLILHSNCFLDT